uniref:PUM-HD domain-containing protein n=1 Tax=Caenorhabditis tropicalis TaxID=1561998 RepID=A0A1I7T751_9PELO
MSRPIVIEKNNKSEPIASPCESLVNSYGAQQIVDSVCGSPCKSHGRRIAVNQKNDRLPDTPEFHFSAYMHQGGKVAGQNTLHMFGTPPSCNCTQENHPIGIISGHMLHSVNSNSCMNPQWNSSMSMFSPQINKIISQEKYSNMSERGSKTDQSATPIETLVKGFSAQQIADSIGGTAYKSHGRQILINPKNETPDSQFSAFIQQGGSCLGRIPGQNMFGAPPSCTCTQENNPINMISGHMLNSINNNNYINQQWNTCTLSAFPHTIQMNQMIPHKALSDPHISQMHQVPTQTMCVPLQSSATGVFANSVRENMIADDLLTRYRANPAVMKGLKLSDIKGVLLKFAKDQVGSRFIQQKLEYCDKKEKDAIFDEVVANAGELVDDIFGNYVVQKFFEYGEEKHWTRLVDAVLDRIPEYAFQMYACRVLQKALEKVNEPLQIKILSKVRHVIHRCMKDQNGNHVIQKAIEKVGPSHIQFIVDTLLNSRSTVYDMSVDPYGCRVVQRCLEHCTPEQKRPIIELILERFEEITYNQYGNYVVQHVIEHGTDADRMLIIKRVSDNLLDFATHKFSSNVIEKCLEQGSIYHKSLMVTAACCRPEGNMPIVVQMMKDQYANYVVQKMFDQVTADQRRDLILTVRPHIPVLRQFPHGKHILAKLDKHFQKQVSFNYPYSEVSRTY